MAAKRTWSVWIPGAISVGDDPAALVAGHEELGRLFRRVSLLSDLTRAEAERIARERHGSEALVCRHRGGRNRATVLYERDLRPVTA